jgi:hypothetical protein
MHAFDHVDHRTYVDLKVIFLDKISLVQLSLCYQSEDPQNQ